MKSFDMAVQEKEGYCLCAVLQSIFKRYNINISQKEIAYSLTSFKNGQHGQHGFLAQGNRIRNFLKSNKFDYAFYWCDETPLNEQDMILKEMEKNNGIIGWNFHVYLLKRFENPYLEVIDPKDCFILKTNICALVRDMYRNEGFFGLIKKID